MSEALDLFSIEYPEELQRPGVRRRAGPEPRPRRARSRQAGPPDARPRVAGAFDTGLRSLEAAAAAQAAPDTVVADAAGLRRQVQDWLARP